MNAGLRTPGLAGLALSLLVAGAGPLAACGSGAAEGPVQGSAQVSETETGGFCAALAVIEDKCARCHTDPPANGAPFPLDSYEATQAPSPSKAHPDGVRSDRMLMAIEANEMPPTALRVDPPVEPLSCEERATLLAWLDDGAPPPPADDPDCRAAVPSFVACDEPPP